MLGDLIQQTAVRFHRHVSRPIVGRFIHDDAYAAIRESFTPDCVTPADLTADHLRPYEASQILSRHGVVRLRHLIAPALADAARAEADRIAARLADATATAADHGVDGGIAWQVGGAILPNQDAIVAAGEPIANMRSRDRADTNGGIVDLYFLDLTAQRNGWTSLAACCAALRSNILADMIATVSRTRLAHINMLRNDSIATPRGLHIDNLLNSYKVFLYLSDATALGDGPYAYVPGSHRRPDLLRREARLNALTGRTESDAHSFEGRALPLFAQRGDAIVSCQSGVHRGLPQRPGASRTVLVAHFR